MSICLKCGYSEGWCSCYDKRSTMVELAEAEKEENLPPPTNTENLPLPEERLRPASTISLMEPNCILL